MSDGPFSPTEKLEKLEGKTFWLKPSTLEKLRAVQDCAPNPDKIIAEIKKAIEQRVDELFESRPKNSTPSSHP